MSLALPGLAIVGLHCMEAIRMNAVHLSHLGQQLTMHHDVSQQEGDPEVIQASQTLVSRNPEDVGPYLLAGDNCREKGDLEQARDWYQQAQAAAPSDPRPAQHLAVTFLDEGRAYRRVEEWELAITAFQEAIRLDPQNSTAYVELARVLYWGLHDSEQALAQFTLALQIDPNNVYTYIWLARFHRDEGELTLSISYLREVVALAPNDPEAHAQMGVTLYEQGALDTAIAELEKAIALGVSPGSMWFYQALGDAYRDAGKTQEAIAAYRQAPSSSYIDQQLEKLQNPQ